MLKPEDIKFLIVHCSDTDDNIDIGAAEIHKMHLDFGWDGIGYHKIIKKTGLIENGRPEFWQGAHVKGLNNKSLGVCLIGRKNFTIDQFNALETILLNWKKKYPWSHIQGHRDSTITDKTCPNFDLSTFLKQKLIN